MVSEQGAGLCAHTQSHPYLTQTYVIIHTAEHMPPRLDIPSAQRQTVVGSKVPGQTIKTRPLMTSPPMKTAGRPASVAKATEWSVTRRKQSRDLTMIAQYTFPLTKHQNCLSWK